MFKSYMQGKQGQISYMSAKKVITLSHTFQDFQSVTAKKFLRFYHATAKKFLQFPGLKLKGPAISRTQKEVLACALFLGCTVASLWLRICSWSITLTIDDQTLSSGAGKGRFFAAAFNPSTWHMSYANIVLVITSLIP